MFEAGAIIVCIQTKCVYKELGNFLGILLQTMMYSETAKPRKLFKEDSLRKGKSFGCLGFQKS